MRFTGLALKTITMPFYFNATNIAVSGGTFNDVGRDMHTSTNNHTDSHDVKVKSDNVSMRTSGNITGVPVFLGVDFLRTNFLTIEAGGIGSSNGGSGTGGNGGAGGSINLNDEEGQS